LVGDVGIRFDLRKLEVDIHVAKEVTHVLWIKSDLYGFAERPRRGSIGGFGDGDTLMILGEV
jgi:hypothetical protein